MGQAGGGVRAQDRQQGNEDARWRSLAGTEGKEWHLTSVEFRPRVGARPSSLTAGRGAQGGALAMVLPVRDTIVLEALVKSSAHLNATSRGAEVGAAKRALTKGVPRRVTGDGVRCL